MQAPDHSDFFISPHHKLISIILPVTLFLIVLVVMYPYLSGYRLSGDDIWFLALAIEGIGAIRDNAIAVAKEQGRIGQLLMLPLNAFGAWLSGELIGRVIILALYVFHLLLFAVYVAAILKRDVRLFLFILLVALHPLAFAFLPPNAYPLQNTVPFIAILLSRIAIVRIREQGALQPVKMALMQVVFAIGMFVSEFAVTFGLTLVIAEYLARFQQSFDTRRQWHMAVRDAFKPHSIVADGLAVLAVIVPYGLFRWWHPGLYEGNSAGGLSRPDRVIGTALGHLRDGTAFPRLGGGLASASIADLLVAILTGGLVALCLYAAAQGVRRIRAPVKITAAALLLAVFVGLPIGMSVKYQEACMDRGACAYLDSRISYLWVSVAVMAAVAYVCQNPLGRVTHRQALALSCAVLGVMASLTSIYNASKARNMVQVYQVWERANSLACAQSAEVNNNGAMLTAIDPQGLIAMNDPAYAADFWKIYLNWRKQLRCIILNQQ